MDAKRVRRFSGEKKDVDFALELQTANIRVLGTIRLATSCNLVFKGPMIHA